MEVEVYAEKIAPKPTLIRHFDVLFHNIGEAIVIRSITTGKCIFSKRRMTSGLCIKAMHAANNRQTSTPSAPKNMTFW